jgi:hypothetical protein
MRIALLVLIVLALCASAAMADGPGLNRGTQSWLTTYSEATGGVGTWSGIYDGVGVGQAKGWFNQQKSGDQSNLQIKADVELFCSQTWDSTGVYFHKADINTPPPAVMSGTLTSNHGEWIGLVVDDPAKMDMFKIWRADDYRLNPLAVKDNPITLVWEMHDSVNAGWSPWKLPESINSPGADNTIATAVWWLLGNNTPGSSAGAAGAYQYQFQCTAQMAALQEAGRYELEPTIVVSPEL